MILLKFALSMFAFLLGVTILVINIILICAIIDFIIKEIKSFNKKRKQKHLKIDI